MFNVASLLNGESGKQYKAEQQCTVTKEYNHNPVQQNEMGTIWKQLEEEEIQSSVKELKIASQVRSLNKKCRKMINIASLSWHVNSAVERKDIFAHCTRWGLLWKQLKEEEIQISGKQLKSALKLNRTRRNTYTAVEDVEQCSRKIYLPTGVCFDSN